MPRVPSQLMFSLCWRSVVKVTSVHNGPFMEQYKNSSGAGSDLEMCKKKKKKSTAKFKLCIAGVPNPSPRRPMSLQVFDVSLIHES